MKTIRDKRKVAFRRKLKNLAKQIAAELQDRRILYKLEDSDGYSIQFRLKEVVGEAKHWKNVSIRIRRVTSLTPYASYNIVIMVDMHGGYGPGERRHINFRANKQGKYNIKRIVDRASEFVTELRSMIRCEAVSQQLIKKNVERERKEIKKLRLDERIDAQRIRDNCYKVGFDIYLSLKQLQILNEFIKKELPGKDDQD